MHDPKCIYRKSIIAKCTRLACLLSFASLFPYHHSETGPFFRESEPQRDNNTLSSQTVSLSHSLTSDFWWMLLLLCHQGSPSSSCIFIIWTPKIAQKMEKLSEDTWTCSFLFLSWSSKPGPGWTGIGFNGLSSADLWTQGAYYSHKVTQIYLAHQTMQLIFYDKGLFLQPRI